MKKICSDCKFLAPRDVFKGFCENKNAIVIIDTDAVDCKEYSAAEKCRFCTNFSSEKGGLGSCAAQKGAMVYADLKACDKYSACEC